MNKFSFYNPVKLIFGEGQLQAVKEELPKFGKKVLLVYGGGSIKKNGLYDEVTQMLSEAGFEVFELAGVEPNPRISTARKGIEVCKKEGIDMLLAVGGGSVIDCTKLIACGAKYDGDAWDLVSRRAQPQEALPFGTVLTIAATGSEMNAGSVITNEETQEKYGWGSLLSFPQFSILDPTYTLSVPANHTVYGIVDMMSHIFEQYFNDATSTPVQDRMCEGVLKAVIETAPKLMENLESYEHRETIMFAGTMALNKFLEMGYRGDWGSHNIEHAVSAVYDIPHAGGLAILFPQWMRHNVKVNPARFAQMAVRVFEVDPADKSETDVANEGIDRLVAFWTSLGAPTRLEYYDIDDSQIDAMVDKAMVYGEFGNFAQLKGEDVKKILQASL